MYRYDQFDEQFVHQRITQFSDQIERRLSGELSEEEFKPLRLMNGLYLQLHAYMLRVAIPYGTLNSEQLRTLASISEQYDKGYGHFTTRQNIQFNWIKLEDTAAILKRLADVKMHAIQTSGNCIRNVTSDPWAGAAIDESEDPRPYAEFMRQWSTLHPEFSFLPRKFKIAISASDDDRSAIRVHDIGLRIKKNAQQQSVFDVYIGGGQGRTPMIASLIKQDLPSDYLLPYLQAILSVYNQYGRRDNMYKARIKILVHELGAQVFSEQVEKEYQFMRDKLPQPSALEIAEIERIKEYFNPPAYQTFDQPQLQLSSIKLQSQLSSSNTFKQWFDNNTAEHKRQGYRIVNISLKPTGGIPGDASADQMRVIADLSQKYSHDELRISHRQNITLPFVKQDDLHVVWQQLQKINLAEANYEMAGDIIACPGLDYCALATARSIPIAQRISQLINTDYKALSGKLHINISGCINACGHHHVGHIGILGLNKNGEEFYQIAIGGHNGYDASLAKLMGPGFSEFEIADAIKTLIDAYLDLRKSADEMFIETYRRVGIGPFKEALYESA